MGKSTSRRVTTNQSHVHPALERMVRRHLLHPFLRPLAAHSVEAFAGVDSCVHGHAGPLILDSGCGVGESSRRLAEQNPHALVIGVDKSLDRLGRGQTLPSNCLLVRANLDDFWRLAVAAGWQPRQHFLLYPNPWPKSRHLQRRWHGSPVFPSLLALGGHLELRSNWELYVQEFCAALRLVELVAMPEVYRPTDPCTPFERKYMVSQTLWRCRLHIDRDQIVAALAKDLR